MPWFNVDDGFAFHRKTVRAGNAAVGLWTRAGSWCAQQLTDGFIPDDVVSVLGTPSQAERLVRAGLWERVEDGYVFHQWNEEGRNPTREKVLQRRKNEAEKKARMRAAKSANPQVGGHRPQGTREGLPEGLPEGVRSTTPLPSQEKKTSSSSGRKAPATKLPSDWQPNDKHQEHADQFGVDLNREVFKFRHHAEANDRRQVNWNAAFTTWLGNAQQWSKPKSAGNDEWRRFSEQ